MDICSKLLSVDMYIINVIVILVIDVGIINFTNSDVRSSYLLIKRKTFWILKYLLYLYYIFSLIINKYSQYR